MSWSRLIRFVNESGNVVFGEPEISDISELNTRISRESLVARELVGEDVWSLKPGSVTHKVKRLLPVLTSEDVPIVRCVGLNYMKHIKEAGRKPPPYPSIFIKPSTTVAGFEDQISIPPIAQDSLDYEGELTIVIGKAGKNITKENALEHIAGYVSSNDISCRKWQRDPAFAGGVPQWCFSKGFDQFAALGPIITSPKIVGAADNLQLQTYVNGELRQNSNTDDLIFPVREIISFLSQGTTLEKGSLIMTGTPSGVGLGQEGGPVYLKDGDIVNVVIEQLGQTNNKMVFE